MLKKTAIEHYVSKKAGMAINQFKMITDGDKVLVGVSGGKDSLTLLKVLRDRKKWVPIDYEIKAVHVTTDYDTHPREKRKKLEEFFKDVGCDYVFKEISIAEKNRKGMPDCFWCSWNRRKAIFETAAELGFKKVAFGHHKDDVVETILMNMIYNGEISGLNPVQSLFKGEIVIVRPLIFLEEKETAKYARECALPVVKTTCPRNDDSRRAVIREIVARLAKEKQDIKSNIVRSPSRVKTEYITDITEL